MSNEWATEIEIQAAVWLCPSYVRKINFHSSTAERRLNDQAQLNFRERPVTSISSRGELIDLGDNHEDHRGGRFYGAFENRNTRAAGTRGQQLYQLVERAAGAGIIFHAREPIVFYCCNKLRITRAANAPADEPEKRTAVFASEYKFLVASVERGRTQFVV